MELVHEHRADAGSAAREGRDESLQDSLSRGGRRFPFENVNFADLVLPDTTYLERVDAISLLDRPISEPDAAADAIRHPILALDGDVRPWQEVLVELIRELELEYIFSFKPRTSF